MLLSTIFDMTSLYRIALLILFLLPLSSFANGRDLLHGKWIAKKYLAYGVENGKAVPLKVNLKPQHFGMFMYLPKQTLEITIPENQANEAGKIPGKIQSDQSLLDPACAKVSDYADYAGCRSQPNSELDFSFRFFEIGSNPSSTEKAMMAAWKKSGLNDISTGFTATAADLSSHIGFVGPQHMVLRVNYFKNPLRKFEDAFASKCPKRNKCYMAFLQFERVSEPSSASALEKPKDEEK